MFKEEIPYHRDVTETVEYETWYECRPAGYKELGRFGHLAADGTRPKALFLCTRRIITIKTPTLKQTSLLYTPKGCKKDYILNQTWVDKVSEEREPAQRTLLYMGCRMPAKDEREELARERVRKIYESERLGGAWHYGGPPEVTYLGEFNRRREVSYSSEAQDTGREIPRRVPPESFRGPVVGGAPRER